MSLETAGYMYSGVVAGVVGGLILRLAQIISKKVNPKQEIWWVEALIAIGLLIAFGVYLAYTFS
ncbi:MAG: hypothetical protein ABIB43_00570 [archaeon]